MARFHGNIVLELMLNLKTGDSNYLALLCPTFLCVQVLWELHAVSYVWYAMVLPYAAYCLYRMIEVSSALARFVCVQLEFHDTQSCSDVAPVFPH